MFLTQPHILYPFPLSFLALAFSPLPIVAVPSFSHSIHRQTTDPDIGVNNNTTPTHIGHGVSITSRGFSQAYPNCDGSYMCGSILVDVKNHPPSRSGYTPFSPNDGFPIYELGRHILPTMPVNDTYDAGQQIACVAHKWTLIPDSHICLFLQGDQVPWEGVTVGRIRELLTTMWVAGCRVCGSVGLSGGRELNAQAMLTANYVWRARCEGACTPGRRRTSG